MYQRLKVRKHLSKYIQSRPAQHIKMYLYRNINMLNIHMAQNWTAVSCVKSMHLLSIFAFIVHVHHAYFILHVFLILCSPTSKHEIVVEHGSSTTVFTPKIVKTDEYGKTILFTCKLVFAAEAFDDRGHWLLPWHYCWQKVHWCSGGQSQPENDQVTLLKGFSFVIT